MKKNPKANQFNRTSGVRTYVPQQGSYVQRVRGTVDRAIEYALKSYQAFMKHSEFKRPYLSPSYNDMEYENPEWPVPGPGPRPGPSPIPGPGPSPPPGPGPTPGPGPSPGPNPTPAPPPWWNNVYFCDISTFFFCPGGNPEVIPINTNDRIKSITVQMGGGSISGRSYIPGSGSGSVDIYAVTDHGADCRGWAFPKDPDLCPKCGSPSIGYTTSVMAFNETQQLTVVDGVSGTTYSWSVSGGGSITSGGLYTAPASNANCASNPTISLICRGAVMATLQIAISNSSSSEEVAIAVLSCVSADGWSRIWWNTYIHCDGSSHDWSFACSPNVLGTCDDALNPSVCNCLAPIQCALGNVDIRSEAQKADGCCPPQLM